MSDYEAEVRARLGTKEGRIEAIKERSYSRRFGSGNSTYIRECADDEYELLGFLAAAEQRAAAFERFIHWLGNSWKTGFAYMEDSAARKHTEAHGPFATRLEGAQWRIAWEEDQVARYVTPAMTALAATGIERANDAPHDTDRTANHTTAERAEAENDRWSAGVVRALNEILPVEDLLVPIQDAYRGKEPWANTIDDPGERGALDEAIGRAIETGGILYRLLTPAQQQAWVAACEAGRAPLSFPPESE